MSSPRAAARQAFVGAGSNLGDRRAYLEAAFHRLEAEPSILYIVSSTIRETAPVGRIDQPAFLNAVFGLGTTLSPEALLQMLLNTEREFGRVRTERWGPRTLDLDLLVYEAEERHSAELVLPHPRMFEREFVLTPLRELLDRPDFAHASWHGLRARLRR